MNEMVIVEEEASAADFSTTPLKKYITVVGDKKDNKWLCSFGCRKDAYTGSYSRVRAHFIGLREGEKSKGIILCCKLSNCDREKLKQEEEEARDFFGGDLRKRNRPEAPYVPLESKTQVYTELTKVESHEEGEASSAVSDDFTSTPLKKYITTVGHKKDHKWLCNFGCRPDAYTGSYSRVRAHMIGLEKGEKSKGIVLCSKLSRVDRDKLKEEEQIARDKHGGSSRKKRKFDPPSLLPEEKQTSVTDFIKDVSRIPINDTDARISRFFFSCGISLNVTRSPFWIDAVKAINEAPKGYKAPNFGDIQSTLIDKEKSLVDNRLALIKRDWVRYGVSIVAEGWSNIQNLPLVNVFAVCGGKPIFVTAIDCSGDEMSASYIADMLLNVIESVGKSNVVQILTDNTPDCKAAGEIIVDNLPHIFWSYSMPHTLSLLLDDIMESLHPSLTSSGICYHQVKDILSYIKNHGSVLHIFKTFPSLEVIQVKEPRFGHQFVLMERLYNLRTTLVSMVSGDDWDPVAKGISNARLSHDEVKKIISDEQFWEEVKFVLSFIKPIWRMIQFCESDKTSIGEVYQRMKDMLSSIKDTLSEHLVMCHEVELLVISRWGKTDLPLHALAYVLNPYYYSESWLQSYYGLSNIEQAKPHSDPFVQSVYLDILKKFISEEDRPIVRKQLSNFTSNGEYFAKPEASEDRKHISPMEWWNLYGVATPQLYSLAIKVLSQSVNSYCGGKPLSSYSFIESIKTNKLNSDMAESLAYVHYNNRILSRYEEEYEEKYKNWDRNTYENYLEHDLETVEDQELVEMRTESSNIFLIN